MKTHDITKEEPSRLFSFCMQLLCNHIWKEEDMERLGSYVGTDFSGSWSYDKYAVHKVCLKCGKKKIDTRNILR